MKEGIEYVRRNDLSVFNQDIESQFVEITNVRSSCGKSIIVGVIYRPPDKDVHKFTLTMCSILEKLKAEKKAIYLSGDYNTDLLNVDKHVPTSEFLDAMFSYFVYSFINRPTRSVKESAILLTTFTQIWSKTIYLHVSFLYPIIFLYFI